jgi:hypothetical protein
LDRQGIGNNFSGLEHYPNNEFAEDEWLDVMACAVRLKGEAKWIHFLCFARFDSF